MVASTTIREQDVKLVLFCNKTIYFLQQFYSCDTFYSPMVMRQLHASSKVCMRATSVVKCDTCLTKINRFDSILSYSYLINGSMFKSILERSSIALSRPPSCLSIVSTPYNIYGISSSNFLTINTQTSSNCTLMSAGIAQRICKSLSTACWKCHHPNTKNDIFCNSHDECGVIQKIQASSEYNYFDIFGMNHQYSVDVEMLDKKYKLLQMRLHPDKFANKSAEERAISAETSSLINIAYQVKAF